MTKPLRQQMPAVAAWIDQMRAAFGADPINDAIRAGIDGQPTFYASENGSEIGTRFTPDPVKTINGLDIHVGPLYPAKKDKRHG